MSVRPFAIQPNTARIHERAWVDEDCYVGPRTRVWQFASITRGAIIGADCVVAPGAMIDGSIVGYKCKIGPGVKMGPGFLIGANVFIGPNVVLCNDAWPSTQPDGFDIDKLLSGAVVAVEIHDKAGVGANATILPGVTLGIGSFVAAGAVCGVSVPPYCVFKRSGVISPINPAWTRRRMRTVRAA